jgi:hypothetical protein
MIAIAADEQRIVQLRIYLVMDIDEPTKENRAALIFPT